MNHGSPLFPTMFVYLKDFWEKISLLRADAGQVQTCQYSVNLWHQCLSFCFPSHSSGLRKTLVGQTNCTMHAA